jgi:hypothetical protein
MDCAVVVNLPAQAEGLGSKTLSRNINCQTPSHGVEWQSASSPFEPFRQRKTKFIGKFP